MRAEEKCLRCKNFPQNGYATKWCGLAPSRHCFRFVKISDKEYAKIVAMRRKKQEENNRRRAELLLDKGLVEQVKENTKNYGIQ